MCFWFCDNNFSARKKNERKMDFVEHKYLSAKVLSLHTAQLFLKVVLFPPFFLFLTTLPHIFTSLGVDNGSFSGRGAELENQVFGISEWTKIVPGKSEITLVAFFLSVGGVGSIFSYIFCGNSLRKLARTRFRNSSIAPVAYFRRR